MKGLLKLVGGIMIGAAIGAGVYLLMTNESEEGVVADVKSIVNDAIEQGKQAADTRRTELQIELGQMPETAPEVGDEESLY